MLDSQRFAAFLLKSVSSESLLDKVRTRSLFLIVRASSKLADERSRQDANAQRVS